MVNAGSVETEGAELDYGFQATRQLKFSGALAYTKARIKHFQCPPGAAASCNVDGTPISSFTPDWKSYTRVDYGIPLGNGLDIELSSDYNWSDKTGSTLTEQGAYGIWNASVALADYNKGWRVALLAKNLTDKSYSPLLASGTGYIYRAAPPDHEPHLGVQVRKDF